MGIIRFVVAFFAPRAAEKLLPGSSFHRYVRDGLTVVRSSAPYTVHNDVQQHLDFGELYFFIHASVQIFVRIVIEIIHFGLCQ